MLFTSQSLYAANFIAPVSVHSLTVSYLPVLVTLQPRYTFRVLQRDIGVRQDQISLFCITSKRQQCLPRIIFYRSRFHRFPVPTTMELLTKVCPLQSDSLKSTKIIGLLFIILKHFFKYLNVKYFNIYCVIFVSVYFFILFYISLCIYCFLAKIFLRCST